MDDSQNNNRPRVLDVGQCVPDHMSLRNLVESMGASMEKVALPAEALKILQTERYDLVFVNRKIDADYTDGMELVRAMQADEKLKTIPIMLISNYDDAQRDAVAAGAIRGFGKNAIATPAARKLLAPYLSTPARSS